MNDKQMAKIKQFLGDREMQSIIKDILKSKFMEKKETEVHYLAAQTLSVQFLEDAWREMERYRKNESQPTRVGQVAL